MIVRQAFNDSSDGPLTRIDLIPLADVVDGATQLFKTITLAFDCSDLYVNLEQQLLVVYENASAPTGTEQ